MMSMATLRGGLHVRTALRAAAILANRTITARHDATRRVRVSATFGIAPFAAAPRAAFARRLPPLAMRLLAAVSIRVGMRLQRI